MADPVTVLCVGLSNTGKSTFINRILEENTAINSTPVSVREGGQMTAVTVDVHEVRLELREPPPSLRGRVLTLVDTPGFNHTDLSDLEVWQKIENFSSKHRHGMNAILYFHAMTDDWISPQMQLGINLLAKFWGPDAMRVVTIVTTKWDLVPKTNAQKRLETLQAGLWKPLLDGGCKIEHLSADEGSSTLLHSILEGVHERPVKLRTQQGLEEEGGHATKTRQTWQRKLRGRSDEHSAALSALRACFWPEAND
ncbi:P-loop containing nucleoside triphosphate hydrolase protein [Coprinellus micaceus]|uniref:P-loop containing nucleoside triphosphate hydrolase protein n=1 Tax=Coprinellus micaceus TaxID=71717 RepID=A0A4Y7SFI7_COPMI|nr:P-loop containing nucleoside triphosphate hydrolase protein [Coprinellus micaceus]